MSFLLIPPNFMRRIVPSCFLGFLAYLLAFSSIGSLQAAIGVYSSDPSGNLIAAFATNIAAPQIIASPVAQIVPPGGNAGFSVIANGAAPLSFQWLKDGTPLPGAISDSLFLSNVTTNNEGNYSVRVSNLGGNVISSPAALFIDSDNDGLADSWERSFFGSLTNQTARGDRDADGVSNLDEFREGTNPTNALSQLPRLNLSVAGPGRVSVSPLLTKYTQGQIVSLTAVPSAGASFLGWSGDITNTQNPLSLTLDVSKNISALFGIPLDIALDTTNLIWRTGGASGWFGQTNSTRDTVDAVQSGPIRQDQQSWLETTTFNPQPVALDFWWALSGTAGPNGSDNLALLVNGIKASGELNSSAVWQQKTVILPPGTNTLRWLYTKRSTTPRYTDIHNGGYVDQVTLRPIAAISVADINVIEGQGGTNNAVFTLRLEQAVTLPASIRFATTNVTASAGSDYLPVSGTVNFPAGSTSQNVSVPILGDLNFEGDESFRLVLNSPTSAYIVDGDATATIHDDEIAPVNLQIVSESCTPGNGFIDPGETVSVAFTLRNPGPLPTSNLSATLLAGNGILAPSPAQSYGAMPPDNSNVTRTFSFTANGPCGSNVTAVLALQDVSGNRGLARFTFTLGGVTTSSNTFFASPISIAAAGSGSPYPSTNIVSGVTGSVSRITVAINGFQHPNPDEVDLLLVSPSGLSVLLLSDAGGTADVADLGLTFDDSAPALIPDNGPLVSGRFKPSNYDTNTDIFVSPAPVGPFGSSLTSLLGSNPNGAWRLFVSDDTAARGGAISNGWSITLETFDSSCCTSENQPDLALSADPIPTVIVGHETTLTLSITNRSLFPASGVRVTNLLPAGLEFVSSTVSQGASSRTGSEITANLGNLPVAGSATLRISFVPTAAGSYTNVASTLGGNADPNFANNFLTSLILVATPSLSIADVVVPDVPTNAFFPVILSTFTSQEVTVRYTTTNTSATAVAGADYLATNGLLRFPPGITTQFVAVTILGDTIDEANETFSVVLSGVTNATIADNLAIGTITDDDLVPGISISDIEVVEGHSGTRNAVFTLTLSSASGQTATVRYSTANGSAIAPADYTARSGTVTFPIGSTSQTITVPVVGDILLEDDETFVLNLSNPVRATLNQTQATCTILDDEVFPVGLSLISENCVPINGVVDPGETVFMGFQLINPGPTDMTNVTVTLVPNSQLLSPGAPVFIDVIPADGTPVDAIFNFSANGYCGSNVVATLLLKEGTNNRGSISYSFRLGVITETTNSFSAPDGFQIPAVGVASAYPSSNQVSGVVGTVSRVTVTLNGFSHLNPDDVDILLVGPGGQTAVLMSDAGGQGDVANLTLTFSDSAPSAVPDSAQLVSGTFKPSDYSTGDTFTAPAPTGPHPARLDVFHGIDPNGTWRLFVLDDAASNSGDISGGWTLHIETFDAACCEDTGFAEIAALGMTTSTNQVFVGHDLAFTFTITNRSPITATGVIITNSLPPGATFVSARGSQGDCFRDGSNVVCILGDVTGFSSASSTVTVAPDRPGSYTNSAVVIASQLDPNTLNNSARTSASAIVPALVVADATLTEGDEGTALASYVVRLNAFTSQQVWVRYASGNGTALNGTDYLAVSGLVTFPPGSTNVTIDIPILGDRLNEVNKTFNLSFSNPTNATLPDATAVVTIADNDPLPILTLLNQELLEGDSGTNLTTLFATLSAPSSRAISVTVTSANGTAIAGTDYVQLRSTTVSFPAGSVSQPITVGIRGDTLIESNETFFINLSSPANVVLATNRTVITIIDDDLRIVDFKLVGNDIRLSFTTAAGKVYRVERAEALGDPTVWETVAGAGNVAGTGGVVEEIDAGGVGRPQRFYRIRQLP